MVEWSSSGSFRHSPRARVLVQENTFRLIFSYVEYARKAPLTLPHSTRCGSEHGVLDVLRFYTRTKTVAVAFGA